ncbi:MAG: soluble NSF attachment family protein [Desulfovibrio sp.]|nr:soluble NSF attachment family protein [Desulfovibrio sp.]
MPQTMAKADSNLGLLQREKGNYPEALALLRNALATEQKAGLLLSQARDNLNLGIVHASTGKFDKAMEHTREGLKLAIQEKDIKEQAIALLNRAVLQRAVGNLKEAGADYSQAAKLFEEAGFQEGQASAKLGIGKMAELADKNYVAALENYLQALEFYSKPNCRAGKRWRSCNLPISINKSRNPEERQGIWSLTTSRSRHK